jgi:YD repeat-containing protein
VSVTRAARDPAGEYDAFSNPVSSRDAKGERRAEVRTAGWLNQQWDGMRTGYAHDRFDRIQRVFHQRA